MDIITGLVWITIIYCVLFFFDTFFKSCAHYPYIKFLHETGFKIKFFHLQWNTTSLNRIFVRWGNSNIRFFNIWFSVGLYATLVLLPISVCLILYAIFQLLCNKSYEEQNIIVEPIIPGINLPIAELGYYSTTLIFCSIIHEAGHALAAVKEDVHLVNVGITLLFVIPVAYVNINFEKLSSLNPWKTLRILCAGVWHNLVLSFIGFLLYMIMSNVFATMFYVNNGIYITEVNPNSLLAGSRGLQIGNIVTNINDCVVRDEITWNNCLLNTWYNKPGFCVTTDLVHSVDESIPILELPNGGYDCCGPTKPDWLCFEYADNNDGILELPPHMCLPARKVVETCTSFCDLNSRICPTNYHCIYPLLPNSTTLLKIKVIQKPDVIYIGHPLDVLHATHVSPYIPRHFFNTPKLPDMVMKLLRYVISFSLGLALVNVIPCIYMDGHHIVNLLTQIVFKERLKSRSAITLISVIISLIGTALLIFLCIYSIWSRMLK
ncbi:membrane-bound transcription factor site-2 protease [Photinus pyralis]|uniref:membrane-bound transcription factor site-2 protease n=1 Tax=Photinus pyralis TaxID=7054 RepID=UPI001267332E|nr:membrane-bound transcription factor site-2 protease [Photinus pyralis]